MKKLYQYTLDSLDYGTTRDVESFEEFSLKLQFKAYEKYIQEKRNEIRKKIVELASSLAERTDNGQLSMMLYLEKIDNNLVSLLIKERVRVFATLQQVD